MYQPIDCDIYDYLEIACMRAYTLHLELSDGRVLDATAQTTVIDRDKNEWLQVIYNNTAERIRLDHICAFVPMEDNASFGRIEISQAAATSSAG